MEVTLIDHMGDDISVVNAARVSFDKESDWIVEDVFDMQGNVAAIVKHMSSKDAALIRYLARHAHWSPFAHTALQFRVRAPIFVRSQLAKHQVGGVINEVSRRYVSDFPEIYEPDVWRRKADDVKQGSSKTDIVPLDEIDYYGEKHIGPEDPDHSLKARLHEAMTESIYLYDSMLRAGVAPEQARMVLPQSAYTEWIWTGSVYFFARVCKQRLEESAQSETREIAQKIADICSNAFPISWDALTNGGRE